MIEEGARPQLYFFYDPQTLFHRCYYHGALRCWMLVSIVESDIIPFTVDDIDID